MWKGTPISDEVIGCDTNKGMYSTTSNHLIALVDLKEQYSCLTIMGNLPCLRRPALGDTLCQPCTVPASHSLEPLWVTFIIT
ncbi:hypothetical protein E2C01_005460 [Portunus trituberculatus]|uniref:Uncharacterized protein n=1 Tax=Portunus trituberculatus TaxID=210409 RepID=A0A5B7CZ87_PORTR|nr:hypothetical protein [Portunus trituberculatus]